MSASDTPASSGAPETVFRIPASTSAPADAAVALLAVLPADSKPVPAADACADDLPTAAGAPAQGALEEEYPDIVVDVNALEAKLRPLLKDLSGTDSNERIYSSIRDLWKSEFRTAVSSKTKKGWYEKGFNYWESEANCPTTDDGVLGGYGFLTPMDARGSNAFLDELQTSVRPGLQFECVADCGAGIGRVSKHLLLPRCAAVHLVEQSPRLLNASEAYIGPDAARTSKINIGLQDFKPAPGTYDMIWIQWVVGQLNDNDFVNFFRRCARGLKHNGVIVLKDNCSDEWAFTVDNADSSVARCVEYLRALFEIAGLEILLERKQTDFPEELCTVRMFALAPTTKKIKA